MHNRKIKTDLKHRLNELLSENIIFLQIMSENIIKIFQWPGKLNFMGLKIIFLNVTIISHSIL